MKNFLHLTMASLISFAAIAGSGIGGGTTAELISWCDKASIIVSSARDEALEKLGETNDQLGALKILYQGFINATNEEIREVKEEKDEDIENETLTYKTIVRGIKLAQLLGVPQIINGGSVESTLTGQKHLQGLLSFMDWYALNIQNVADQVDRNFIPYSKKEKIPAGTYELERQLVEVAVSQVKGLDQRFVRLKSDHSSFYTTIPTQSYLQALAYIADEVAKDLKENVFANAFSCQAKGLIKLNRQIQSYLDGREDAKNDALKLNKFVLDTRKIVDQITSRNCSL